MPRGPSKRYGIAEWYGTDILKLTVRQRKAVAAQASAERARESQPVSPCPFLGSLKPGALCNKAGGVCSARPYTMGENNVGEPSTGVVTFCPNRFLEGAVLLKWVAEVMLGSSDGISAVKETPFLRRTGASLDADNESKAGRIDWILVDPTSLESGQPKWCALETQSLYFSGRNMTEDFNRYVTSETLIFPDEHRRPDYRSGGPKRLSPQLTIKVPLLARWNIKTAVLVDRYFFNEMSTLQEFTYEAEADRLANADVVWFVCDYSDDGHLLPDSVHYSTLGDSISALNAAEPIARNKFVEHFQRTLATARNQGTKVFKLS